MLFFLAKPNYNIRAKKSGLKNHHQPQESSSGVEVLKSTKFKLAMTSVYKKIDLRLKFLVKFCEYS